MVTTVRSLGLQGISGYEVTVECFLSGGLPAFDVVGLGDTAVKEARERVRAAIKNCGAKFPVSRITVNLAPANLKKEGTVYDLPLLLGILAGEGEIDAPDPLKTVLLRLVQGFIIGAGGILPGISGGVLSVIFGIYRPVMEVLAHPLNGLRRHLSLLLPVGAGAILGFLCGGGLILVLFDRSEKLAICLFIGLILGTLPSLWAEAGAQGRGRGAYLSCAASFLALSAVLLYAQYGAFYTMRPGFLGFLFCGLLWGLSLIVPGMTSSSILMAVGLFTPMAEGFARLDMAVILPWLLGMALIVLTLARVVNWCFQTHYPLFYHAVFGIVLASTVVIIPLHYDGARDALLCLLAAALGALAAYLSAKLQPKEDA